MITLEQIGQKLNRILNGQRNSADTGESWTSQTAPTTNEYSFAVKTNGFHLDKINNADNSKNLVFVFVDSLGGEINNVKSLKEIDYNTEITFYYPVRFKDDFYSLNSFLYDTFVEQFLNFGTSTNKDICLTAISVAQYGEISIDNFQQLATFINNNYPLQVAKLKSEMYMSMTFTLYLSTVNGLNQSGGLLMGNSWNTSIKTVLDGSTQTYEWSQTIEMDEELDGETELIDDFYQLVSYDITNGVFISLPHYNSNHKKIEWRVGHQEGDNPSEPIEVSVDYKVYDFVDDEPIFITETNISNSEPIAEQILGQNSSKGLPVSTAYTKELPIYVKNNANYKILLNRYLNRQLQQLIVYITETNTIFNITKTSTYYITNMSMVKTKGEMLGITLTLAERID